MSKVPEDYRRDKDDFFASTPDIVLGLMASEGPRIPIEIWEPACGDGAICRTMPAREWIATDLVDRGFGRSGIDFLMERKKLADAIITNAPFKLMYEFMHKAIELDVRYIAMLHPVGFLNTTSWQTIFGFRRPARIYSLTWRPDIFGIGSPDQRCRFCWSVWDGHVEQTTYDIMRKP